MGYLDSTGLSEVLTKIKNYSDGKDATLNTNISTVATNLASTDAIVSALATRVGNLEGASLKYEIVTALPTTGIDTHTIYMIKDKETGEDRYNEYLYVNAAWELIGNTDIDLSGYQTKIDSSHKLSASLVSGLATIATSGKLSDASGDTTHRTVTDAEKTTWNNKANASTTLAGYGITNAYTKTETDNLLGGYVEKETGKGLSTNDYTTTEKNKLSGIASGAEVNVQADWNETTTTSDAYIKNKPAIPSEVTESTVSGWGFTKNTGTYSKPSTGIPKTDLASAVQTSLGKADSALQSESDPVFSASAAAGISSTDITNWNSKTSNVGTVTSVAVKMNGTTKGTVTTSGTIDLGTVITAHQDISGKQDSLSTTQMNAVNSGITSTKVSTYDGYATTIGNKVDKVTGKGLSTNDYTTDEKNKLAGIASGAEVNQNAYSSVEIVALDATTKATLTAVGKTSKLKIREAGSIKLYGSVVEGDNAIVIEATDTTYSNATTSKAGLMSTADKTKLDGLTAMDVTEIDTICDSILV